jgi:pyridoxal phosphate enzyme (YggS family)
VNAELEAGLLRVRERIASACRRAGRPEHAVRLLAVSKGQPIAKIRAAYAAGEREFGESYVQELADKARQLGDLPELRWRFVGRLQRNKARHVAELGCAVDSLDSLSLAQALSSRAAAAGQSLAVMLQVNIDDEPQKAGAAVGVVSELAVQVAALPALRLRGLMAIPRASADPEAARPAFRRVRELGEQIGLPELSIGMSADLEVAIEEGATIVRVGTAIFGPRAG